MYCKQNALQSLIVIVNSKGDRVAGQCRNNVGQTLHNSWLVCLRLLVAQAEPAKLAAAKRVNFSYDMNHRRQLTLRETHE